MARNSTKTLILEALKTEPLTAQRIQGKINEKGELSLQAVRMCLTRCKKWNLIRAEQNAPGSKERIYALTEKGIQRLEWLRGHKVEMPSNQRGIRITTSVTTAPHD